MIRIHCAGLLAVIAIPLGFAPPASAFPLIRFWPNGDFPCDTTLQACIDGAGPDDQIRIATDGPIQEEIAFSKPLALVAQGGYHPLISSPAELRATANTAYGDQTIRIDGLSFDQGGVGVTQSSSGTATFQITNNSFLGAGIGVVADPNQAVLGAISFDVSGNTFASLQVPGIYVATSDVSASGSIADNTIKMSVLSTEYAIKVDGGNASVDVVRNRISGAGIGLYGESPAMNVRVLGNLVTTFPFAVGPTDGIDGFGLGAGNLSMTIVNNTLANSAKGISIVDYSGQAVISCAVSNNVITGNGTGFARSSYTPSMSGLNNLFFGNTVEPTSGSGFDFQIADPRYVSASDFHVRPGSPAIDAGFDAFVPGDLLTDLDGNPRIQGSHVDIGAYEAPEPSRSLCAMADLSVLGALGLRRRSSQRSTAALAPRDRVGAIGSP